MSAVSGLNFNNAWSYAKRVMKMYPDFVFGTGNETTTDVLRDSFYGRKNPVTGKRVGGQHFKGFGGQLKRAFKAGEQHNLVNVKQNGGFFKSTLNDLITTPDVIKAGWQNAGQRAANAGKTGISKFFAQTKGGLGGFAKRIPLIGSLLMVACELPNIISATKEKGLLTGLKETGKAGARLGAGMAGAAIGQALIPIPLIGGLIGYMAGDWLASKVVGKSYSEKKIEAEEQRAQQQEQLMTSNYYNMQNTYQPNINNGYVQSAANTGGYVPFKPQIMPTLSQKDLMMLQRQLYSGKGISPMDEDFMMMSSGLNRLA